MRTLARALRALASIVRWRTREVVHRTPLKAMIACERCEQQEGTVRVPSSIEDRDVFLCEWCYRAFRRANELRAIPKTRKPKGGPTSGRAA